MSENVIDLAEGVEERTTAALTKGVFNLKDALDKRTYPTAKVIVYLDAANIVKLSKANDKMTQLAQAEERNIPEYEKYERAAEKFKKAVLASALTVHLRGVDSGVYQAKRLEADTLAEEKGWSAGEREEHYEHSIIAASMVKVEDVEGNADQREFTVEDVDALAIKLPIEQFVLIDRKVAELTFETSYFDSAVDAGFLPTS